MTEINSTYWFTSKNTLSDSESDAESDSESIASDHSDIEQDNDLLKKIDQKIILKFMKEGKTSRTYIIGIHSYFKSEDDTNKFMKNLQKKLGTSYLKKMVDDVPHFGFCGDHIDKICEEIIKNNIAKKHDIKK
jgi:hypothetical protein